MITKLYTIYEIIEDVKNCFLYFSSLESRWSLENKQKLIKALLGSIPLKPCYLFIENPNDSINLRFLDGKDKILTILSFVDNKFRYNGLLFKELQPYQQRKITDTYINFYFIEKEDKNLLKLEDKNLLELVSVL